MNDNNNNNFYFHTMEETALHGACLTPISSSIEEKRDLQRDAQHLSSFQETGWGHRGTPKNTRNPLTQIPKVAEKIRKLNKINNSINEQHNETACVKYYVSSS